MLEAADMRIVHIISPFLGSLMNRASDESKTCLISTSFTYYVDIMSDICGNTKHFNWKEDELV